MMAVGSNKDGSAAYRPALLRGSISLSGRACPGSAVSASCDAILDEGILFGPDEFLGLGLFEAGGAFGVASRGVGHVGGWCRWGRRRRGSGLGCGSLGDIARRPGGGRAERSDADAEGDRAHGKTH